MAKWLINIFIRRARDVVVPPLGGEGEGEGEGEREVNSTPCVTLCRLCRVEIAVIMKAVIILEVLLLLVVVV